MPSNIENANISAIKLGTVDMTKGYIGHEEVYPNTRQIQSAAYTNTSTLSSSGGTRLFRVTGDIGSTYDLTGSGAGSYILASSPYDHSVSVGANTACSAPARNISTTLTPTDSTVLQGGGSSFSSSFTQSASPNINQTFDFGLSVSISNTNYVTTTYNGTLMWANGAAFSISYSGNNTSGGSVGIIVSTTAYNYSNVSGTLTPGTYTTVGPGSFSGSFTGTYPGPYREFIRANLTVNSGTSTVACFSHVMNNNGPGSLYSSNVYP